MVRYGKVGKGNEAYKKDNLDEALAYYTQGSYSTEATFWCIRLRNKNGFINYYTERQLRLKP